MSIPNSMIQEEHDFSSNSKKVLIVGSNATIYAVVNTGAAGIGNSIVTVANFPTSFGGNVTLDKGSLAGIVGNVTISDSKGFIGLVTTQAADPKGFIGLTTVVQASTTRTLVGNLTLTDSKGFIGLTTTVNGTSWPDPKTFIGLVTVGNTVNTAVLGNVTISDSKGFIGLVTVVQSSTSRSLVGNLTLTDAKTNIGLVTLSGGTAWADPKTFIGLVTVGNTVTSTLVGNITVSDSKGFIGLVTLGGGTAWSDPKTFVGLVTAVTKNGGTAKTLTLIPVTLSQASQITIAVPTTNLSIYVTQLLLNSDATVRVNIKSGVTYLTGNVTLGITLNPGGGWVESGSPDSPIYISTASASINIEKLDLTATKANIGGKVVYFQE